MTIEKDPTTIGLSESAHTKLKLLKENGLIREMVDGYRLAIAVALAHGRIAPSIEGRTTIFNVGTVFQDASLLNAIVALRESSSESPYRTAERLAEWGVDELSERSARGSLPLLELLRDAEHLSSRA